VSAFVRAARTVVLAALISGLGAGSVLAQNVSGKLEGTVRDQAGAPIANAQVFIVGTTFATTTNTDGYYFLNNVPIGTVTLQASFIGYKATQIEGLKILSNQTSTQDVTLEATPFEVEEITVVAAVNPLVPRDEVTTKQRVDGEYTRELPVDRVTAVLALQPGVVTSAGGGTLFIRGGRADEAALYIDGIPAQAGNRNLQGQTNTSARSTIGTSFGPTVNTVSVNSFEQASVTTGGAAAEFGNAQSGVIAIQTRTGGAAWTGSLNYESNAFTTSSNGLNRIRGSLSGPITSGLTFFLGGDLEGRQSANFGQDREKDPIFVQAGNDMTIAVPDAVGDPTSDTSFVDIQKWAIYTGECDAFSGSSDPDIASNYGQECRGSRLPGTTNSNWRLTSNLNWSYGTGSRLKASAIFRQNQTRGFNPVNPINVSGTTGQNRIFQLNWTQNLSQSAERALALEVGLSYQQDRFLQSPMTRETDVSTYAPFGGFMIGSNDYVFDRDNFPIDDALVRRAAGGYRTTSRTPTSIVPLPSSAPMHTGLRRSGANPVVRRPGSSSVTRTASSVGPRSTGRSTGSTGSSSAASIPTTVLPTTVRRSSARHSPAPTSRTRSGTICSSRIVSIWATSCSKAACALITTIRRPSVRTCSISNRRAPPSTSTCSSRVPRVTRAPRRSAKVRRIARIPDAR
jgi:hypothetical protein